jgi:xanthine dehydrogenase YagR molybdenum-binding subunit
MYACPNVDSLVSIVRAGRNTPGFMRAPPEVPYMFALESAMDELAFELKIDPIELRRVNDTMKEPIKGNPFTSRSLMACFDEGAKAFGWSQRKADPKSMADGDWLIGYGCATSCYPTQMAPAAARVHLQRDGQVRVQIAGHEIGNGAYTVIGQAAAEKLGVPVDKVSVFIGDSDLPPAPVAGGSNSTASTCSTAIMVGGPEMSDKIAYAFGAEFIEVRINRWTHEIRVPRLLRAFAAGHIMNPRTARSQLMGGLIWGMSSALHEATELDERYARYVNDNLADYLLPVNADLASVEVIMLPEQDDHINPAGVKGIGELGNVGTNAAVCNAIFHATGQRLRKLPIRLEQLNI